MSIGLAQSRTSGCSINHRPWSLVVSIEFQTEREAVRFEKYLKSGSGRAFAKRHFGGGKPGTARDLSRSLRYFALPPMAKTVYLTSPGPALRTWCMVPYAM